MSKVKPSKEHKIKSQDELSEEEVTKLMEDLDNFDNSFMSFLADTQSYEIVPTSDDIGNTLNSDHYSLIKKECIRMNVKIIYSIDLGRNTTLLFCPDTNKFGVLNSAVEMH